MWLFSLLGGVKGLAMIALVIAIAGWAFMQRRAVEKAEQARDQAIVQRDMAARERDKAIEVARVNEQTIIQLQQEKEDINEALNALQAARETSRTRTVEREVIIQRQAGQASSQAVTAPVIGSIIEEVQNDRVRRRNVIAPPPPAPAATAPANGT